MVGFGRRTLLTAELAAPPTWSAASCARPLSERMCQAFTVDNKPGAGGSIAAQIAFFAEMVKAANIRIE